MLLSLLIVLQLGGSHELAREPLSAPVGIERQIHWQRSLEDALAISAAENRPILIAVNMDGESASEHIVRERYRDPKFVALTRRFVCLGTSAFRHAERDHTFEGRRVLSPRLGAITSGEAIALEPIVFDKYLGGERIAPRHALILRDGHKEFDLFQLFDLRELDRRLDEAQVLAPPFVESEAAPVDAGRMTAADWLRLARAVDNRQRARFEALLAPPAAIEQLEAGLNALLEVGDRGSCEALRIAFARCGEAPSRIVPLATRVARARGIEQPAAALLREMLIDTPERAAGVSLGPRAELLDALAELGGAAGSDRSLILSYAVAGEAVNERARALRLCGGNAPDTIAQAIDSAGGPSDPARVLAAAHAIARETPWRASDELGPADEVEAQLQAADEDLSAHPGDTAAQARFGKAALAAARSRIESRRSGVELLLSDAQKALSKVVETAPENAEAWLLLARASYLNSDFESEERAALGALAALPKLDPSAIGQLLGAVEAGATQISRAAALVAEPRERLEALRWLADASARLLAVRSGGDIALEAAGMARGYGAATLAALSPLATATDWLTLSAIHAALGRRGEEIAIARTGLDFFPDSQELRNAYYLAVWDRGYSGEARRQSELIADRHPRSATARWYVGYAAMREGDSLRRAEDPLGAISAYGRADQAFVASVQLSPDFQDSADYYRALAALGAGFARLLIGEREGAAERLVAAVAIRPSIVDVRDALDREAVDLLDGALEWHASGPSPVEPLALARQFERADPGNPRWARRISDSMLREGLRADGRSDPTLGDRYLESSIAVARLSQAASSDDADRRSLAQALAVHAERRMSRAEFAAAGPLLREAASLLDEPAPSSGASDGEWIELGARLRARLGDARPVFRPGR